jgi:exodeoxyribonuclease VII large subunit
LTLCFPSTTIRAVFSQTPLFTTPETWSVTDLNRYVRQSLEADYRLKNVTVAGEISGFKAYPSGHWYFTLKDAGAQVNCVLWRARAARQAFTPRDGDAVTATGHITLYEQRGQFQFDVATLERAGQGDLFREFELLKARLRAEGLFDRPKRDLPRLPRVIGLVTSPAGAALRDMLNILRRRLPLARVILSPTPVQGAEAPPQIIEALQRLIQHQPDVVIIGRGGGALEDLWCFNDEGVARAIAALPIPTISGVGHEVDFTIADFVADVRAPTPSAAAELITAISVDDLRAGVDGFAAQLTEALSQAVQAKRWALAERQARLLGLSPRAQLSQARQRLAHARTRSGQALRHHLQLERERLNGLVQALNTISPLAVLGRGYALVTHRDGALVRRADEVQMGETLRVRVSQGEFETEVVSK